MPSALERVSRRLASRLPGALAGLAAGALLAGCGLSLSTGGSSASTATTSGAASSSSASGASTALQTAPAITATTTTGSASGAASGAPGADAGGEVVTAPPAAVQAQVAQADSANEVPTPAVPQKVFGGWRTPRQAVWVFADTYINWTAQTVSAHMGALALVSVGQARSAMQLASGETARDYELRRGGIANSGTVEAVAPEAGHPSTYVVVTLEQTTATNSSVYRGLAPAWHVALATVVPVKGGLWVLSSWQPEN